MTHLSFEVLSEVAENPQARAREPHLAECDACRETLRRIEELIGAARSLPREVTPPPEIWSELRTRMTRAPAATSSVWRIGGWIAAAAAIVIVAGLSVLMPGSTGKAKGAKLPGTLSVASPASAALVSVERQYAGTLDELRRSLDSQRSTLSPATVRIVERSLATIDTAIAEARAALASDPANQALSEILSAVYERKVELLQRATELSSSL